MLMMYTQRMKSHLLICLLGFEILTATPALAQATDWNLIEPGGETACAAGTPFRFWMRPGPSDDVLVYFQGGGGCWDYDTCQPNSRWYDSSVSENEVEHYRGGIFDFDNPANPFRDYNMVFVPSCNGDVYMGNNTVEYQNAAGDTLTHRFKGFANGSAAINFVTETFTAPRSIFVTGCSAGSVGSAIFAPYLIDHYPGVPVAQLGDSLSFVFHRPVNMEIEHGASSNFAQWIPALRELDTSAFLMADYYAALANFYPDYAFAQFNSLSDHVQIRFYNAIGGQRANWERDLTASLDSIHARAGNFRSFTAGGQQHCVLPNANFYTYVIDGVSLRDWVADLAAGEDVPTLRCDDCSQPERLWTP